MNNNSMYMCQRCEKPFDSKGKIIRHLNNKVPCDKFCNKCGHYQTSRSSYQRHVKEPCEPIPTSTDVNNLVINNTNGESSEE